MKRLIVTLLISAATLALQAAEPFPLKDKTLVAWAAPANLTQRGGSILTLDDQRSHFDGIVFGEVTAAKWMVGSNFYRRTQREQAAYPVETTAGTLVQIAITYHGTEITAYRDGKQFARYQTEEPQEFGKDSAVVIGLRHLESRDGESFAGAIDDARLYNVALTAEQIAALKPNEPSDPKPLAWWNFQNGKAEDTMGTFPPAKLVGSARVENGKLILDGKGSYMITPDKAAPPPPPAPLAPFDSPIHYRPAKTAMADTIPFFWKGEYHVFYLRVSANTPWEHIVSTDLVHWRELPTALVSDGPPESPDGGNMFTGSVTEKDGTFHIFYTGHNSRNPKGVEFVCHATSPDLVTWTKHPDEVLAPDGVIYDDRPQRDFRDPYVFYNDVEKRWWMVFFGNEAKTHHGVQGLAVSDDLKKWEFQPPLEGAGGQECPDLFRIGKYWYLIGGDHYSIADAPRGPYRKPPVSEMIDRPNVYAAKRMFDGQRHIWTGWVWDIPGHRDGERGAWGGTQCLPREIYAGPEGQLYSRPVETIPAAFKKVALQREKIEVDASASFDVPDHYMLECQLQLDPKAELVIAMRQQADGSAYRFTLNPDKKQAKLNGPGFNYQRPCPVDTSRPVKFQAFVQGTIIECFINDQYAESCRAYNYQHGKLAFEVRGAKATVLSMNVKVDESEKKKKTAASAFLYQPENGVLADVIPFHYKDKFHILYLQLKPGQKGFDWAQLITRDFASFEQPEIAIPGGGTEDAVDLDIFTGSVIAKDDTLYAFYTGHNGSFQKLGKPDQIILRANSRDGVHWTKEPDFRFAPEGDARYRFPGSCRDPFVFWNPEQKEFGMLFCASPTAMPAGGLAYAGSGDLHKWRLDDPSAASGRFPGYECPDLFKIGSRWYLLFSTYDRNPGWATRYMTAPQLAGPWQSPTDDFLDGGSLYAAKTVSDGQHRYLCGTLPSRKDKRDDGQNGWGGRLLIYEVAETAPGQLGVRIPGSVEQSFGDLSPLKLPGAKPWETVDKGVRATSANCRAVLGQLPSRALLRLELTVPPTGRAGVFLAAEKNGEQGFRFFVDVATQRLVCDRGSLQLGGNPEMERPYRPLKIKPGDHIVLKFAVDGDAAVACVNDTVCLATRIYDRRGDTFGLWSDTVGAEFRAPACAPGNL